MTNIGIIDADLIGRKNHRFPNLACMKISGYEKEQGNNIKLITDYKDLFSKYNVLDENEECIVVENLVFYETVKINKKKETRWYSSDDIIFDKIVISKAFLDTPIPERLLELSIVQYGGTGFFYDKAEPLPDYIEHHKPDYHLYDEWVSEQLDNGGKKKDYKYYTDYSIGFTTRGCFRKCGFCVNKNYNKVEIHSPIEEFLDKDRKYICLLDDNILGFGQWKHILEKLQATGKRFEYKQGMDLRLMTDEKAKILTESKYIGDYIFAFDNIADKYEIEEKLKLWRKYCTAKGQNTKLYVFCAFDRNDIWDEEFWARDIKEIFERVKLLMRYNCLPYIMRYDKYRDSPYYGMYVNIASWGNQPNLFKKKSFREWCIADDKRKGGSSATIRYLEHFENKYIHIADNYFDLKFDELNEYKNKTETK